MAYSTGTVVGARNDSPSKQFAEIVRDLLLTHANWTHVVTFVDAAAYRHIVMRNSGVGSESGNPWFMSLVAHNTSVTDITFRTFIYEEFDNVSVPKLCRHQAPMQTAAARTQIASGAYNDTWNELKVDTSATTATSQDWYNDVQVSAVGGTYDYWLLATKHGLYFSVRVGTVSHSCFAGMYQSFVPNPSVNDPFPLINMNFWRTNNPSLSMSTRVPPIIPAGRSGTYWGNIQTPSQGGEVYTRWSYQTGYTSTSNPDGYQGGAPLASRISVMSYTVQHTNGASQNGAVRGLLHDALHMIAGSGATHGDTVTISGNTYVYTQYNVWLNTAAN